MTLSGKVDALLFDLGQVVISIDFNRAFSRWGEFASCDDARIRNRFSHDEHYKKHETGQISHVAYFETLRHSLGINISDAQFLAGWNAIFTGEMPGIANLLRSASQKLPLYAFSNSNPAHEACWPELYGTTLSNFRTVFVSSTIGLRKPDAAAFEHVVSEIGVPAERIVFFDDAEENVDGARSFGLQVVHVTTPDCVRQAVSELGL